MQLGTILWAVVCVGLLACTPDDDGRCTSDRTATFGTVGEAEPVIDITIRDIRFERLGGDVMGYREGIQASLLLYGAQLQITPPCGAREVEVVLDQTQVGFTATLFQTGDETAFHTAYSETTSDLEPENGNYQRWTIYWPGDMVADRILLSNSGSIGVSTLLKSITFR